MEANTIFLKKEDIVFEDFGFVAIGEIVTMIPFFFSIFKEFDFCAHNSFSEAFRFDFLQRSLQ